MPPSPGKPLRAEAGVAAESRIQRFQPGIGMAREEGPYLVGVFRGGIEQVA